VKLCARGRRIGPQLQGHRSPHPLEDASPEAIASYNARKDFYSARRVWLGSVPGTDCPHDALEREFGEDQVWYDVQSRRDATHVGAAGEVALVRCWLPRPSICRDAVRLVTPRTLLRWNRALVRRMASAGRPGGRPRLSAEIRERLRVHRETVPRETRGARDPAPPRRLPRPRSQAFSESWFRKLNEREVWLNEYETLDDARRGIGGYVDRYQHRPHSGLNYRTPLEVRQNLGQSPNHHGLACQHGRGARHDPHRHLEERPLHPHH
jgi:hypothetical protein